MFSLCCPWHCWPEFFHLINGYIPLIGKFTFIIPFCWVAQTLAYLILAILWQLKVETHSFFKVEKHFSWRLIQRSCDLNAFICVFAELILLILWVHIRSLNAHYEGQEVQLGLLPFLVFWQAVSFSTLTTVIVWKCSWMLRSVPP